MSKKPLGLITFDVDDTLYSTTDFVKLARENSLKAMIANGLDIDPKVAMAELLEVIAEFTSNDEHHFDRLLERVSKSHYEGVNPAVIIAAGVSAYHDTVYEHLKAYEDVLDTVQKMHARGYRMGVISQGWTVKQARKLVKLRILPYLDKTALFFSEQMGMCKGNPKFFLRASERTGVDPSACVHIGDRPDRDIDPANRAGWVSILNARSGRYHQRQGETPPAHTIHNFWDLAELMEKAYAPA